MKLPAWHRNEFRLPCGCKAVWNQQEGQYNQRCTCSLQRRQARNRAAKLEVSEKNRRFRDVPLYRKPFSLFR